MRSPTILEVMEDPQIWGSFFAGTSWSNWKILLKAAFNLPLSKLEKGQFRKLTKRGTVPDKVKELWIVAGRRSGKSKISALIACYLAFFVDWSASLTPGERGHILVINPDRRQGRVLMGYVKALIDSSAMLSPLVERETSDSIYLTNGVVLEIGTCSYRSVRGYTLLGCTCDELGFWRAEGTAVPDAEVLQAVKPAMATVASSMLIGISSPHSRRGVLWRAWKQHYGQERNDILVVQAESTDLNPTIDKSLIEAAYEEDPVAAASEWGGAFRRDIEGYVSPDVVEACTISGRKELPPVRGLRYAGFVDPSGGSGSDAMTLAVAHQQDGRAVLDCVRERRPPFSPMQVVEEFADVLLSYGVTTITGDRYAGEWPREQFLKAGIRYMPSKLTKTEIYRDLLPHLNSAQVELLDVPKLLTQLCNLERRTSRGGRDSIDHLPGTHDDVINSVAGALLLVAAVRKRRLTFGRDRDHLYDPRRYDRTPLPCFNHEIILGRNR